MEIRAENRTGIVTIEVETSYGQFTLTYSPADVEAGIGQLADQILSSPDSSTAAPGTEDLRITSEQLRDAASYYYDRETQLFPKDALEQFTPGSAAYTRGTIDQFSENLAPALISMLDYLAASALVSASSDVFRRPPEDISKGRDEMIADLKQRFADTIVKLWARDQNPGELHK